MTNSLSVIVAGGGTAGHVEPALAVADALRALDPSITVTALGTTRGLENTLVPARGYPLELVPQARLQRKVNAELLKLPAQVWSSVRQTRAVINRVHADVIIGFGGYVALPAYLAAGSVPVVVHEANAKAGIANKIGARRATRVLAALAGSGVHARGSAEAELVGIPVRSTITELDRAALRAEARAYFGLPQDGPVLLVFGGSQGAQTLNRAVSGAAVELAAAGISVLHAYGPKNSLDLPERTESVPYVGVPYLERMDLAYAAADATICRSGAMTVAEVSAVGLPAWYVPLPHGNGEQELNARPVVAAGGGTIVADAQLTPSYIATEVIPVLREQARLVEMGRAAADAGHRDAATNVAKIVLEVARGGAERG